MRRILMSGIVFTLLACTEQGASADTYWTLQSKAQSEIEAGRPQNAVAPWKILVDHYANIGDWTNAALFAKDLAKFYDQTNQYDEAVTYYELENQYWLKAGKDWGAEDSQRAEELRTVVELYQSTRNPEEIGSLSNPTGNLAKYEPESGVYLGLYSERDPNMGNYFSESKSIYGKDHALYLAYCPWGTSFPKGHAERAKEAGAGLQVGWEPSLGLDAVKDDAYVRQWARDAKASGIPIFLRYACEMNGSWEKWSGDPVKYIEKFRLISQIMKEEAPNVAMVWSPGDVPKYSMSSYYPGDSYVDWVGVSLYTEPYDNGDPNKPQLGATPIERLDELYSLYADRKPVMLSETGVSSFTHADGRSFTDYAVLNLHRLYDIMPKKYPRLKAITYFNVDLNGEESNNDYSLRDNPTVFNAYREIIQQPYFLSKINQGASVPIGYKKVDKDVFVAKQTHLVPFIKYPGVTISKVDYVLNGQVIHTSNQPPFDAELQAKMIGPGSLLELRVYNSNGEKVASKGYTLNSEVSVDVDGKPLFFDQPPVLKNGTTLVPLRKIFETLGASVSWDASNQTVTVQKDGTMISLQVGQGIVHKNTERITLNQPAEVLNGRTLVPLRFVSEALGAKVEWNADLYSVEIATPPT